ncbi:hypothetical protein AVEN_236663-1, partial [Araneus ventricosus]
MDKLVPVEPPSGPTEKSSPPPRAHHSSPITVVIRVARDMPIRPNFENMEFLQSSG